MSLKTELTELLNKHTSEEGEDGELADHILGELKALEEGKTAPKGGAPTPNNPDMYDPATREKLDAAKAKGEAK